jgi:hypothetical protein
MNNAPKYKRRRRIAVAIALTAIGAGLWHTADVPDSPKCAVGTTTQECHRR